MGRHSAPEGKPSSSERMTGKRDHIGGPPRHSAPEGKPSTYEQGTKPAGSDLPARDSGLR